ncbi:MAG: hypothetical protein JW737_02370 [Acidobacteria bacterium]|nr:hypothetical protein [Acidobacteriota bacterium]
MKFLVVFLIMFSSLSFSVPPPDDAKPEFKADQQRYIRVREARAQYEGEIKTLFQSKGILYPPEEIILVAYKNDMVFELWAAGKAGNKLTHIKDYAICMTSGELGPKRREGDLQIPEGFYEIVLFNPVSSYHLSMKINYPNASDRILSDKKHPGGLIYIHGSCVTIGCIPITNRWIKELYIIAVDTYSHTGRNITVYIFPTRLDRNGIDSLYQAAGEDEKLINFWENLKDGYNKWVTTGIKIKFKVNKTGQYIFQ